MIIFGEKSVGRPEKGFSSEELLEHVELLLKCTQSSGSTPADDHYSWLRAKQHRRSDLSCGDVYQLKPMIDKMKPENSAAIAVKLDSYVDQSSHLTTAAILDLLKNLLEEQCDAQMMEKSLKNMKQLKKTFVKRNKVKPVLLPPGREARVCFIIEREYC